MIELRKLIVFLLAFTFFIYLLCVGISISKKINLKKPIFILMLLGVGLITAGTFLDVIAKFINIEVQNILAACFTVGTIFFVVFIIFLSNKFMIAVNLLYEDANMDKMTGAYNRRGINEIFQNNIAKNNNFYIMLFDLDGTKKINDKYGHAIGDKYIVESVLVIKSVVGTSGFVGRIGGDEFIALLKIEKDSEVEEIKQLIKRRVRENFKRYDASVSIGHAKYKRDGQDFEAIFLEADKNMYRDKRINKSNIKH
ncbi:GGDEF domain-containing protein [Clostridium felsineum]|uniref:Uncharacterized protein n=1 Tax=Clostridium felsineum TaxID=36839 RepID=A0A1S8MCP8_9CLOT|nr:GGDEF domain-containing protein [Clostridium felsineum]URZ00436.1 hypothetical protein CLAUR_004240 [Clostridium felsineum]URZ06924.1 hypothetical protein CLROS_022570 [Clostridium felsineum]URZ11956.1 hypothetical protein CROST_026730 [Clostridium felsineum]